MIWDNVFWVWFALTCIVLLSMLLGDPSIHNMYLAMLLAGLGFLKLAEEGNRKEKSISKKLLEKIGL